MRGLVLIGAVVVSSAPTPATADVLKVYVEAHGGGMFGKGTSGDLVDAMGVNGSFFESASPGTYGGLIGVRFVFASFQIQHHQYIGSGHLSTWTQFGPGLDFEVPIGKLTAEDKKANRIDPGYVSISTHLLFGVGTGQQVMPPLSNDEVTDKGFLLQGALGIGKHLNKVFDIGVSVPASYGYLFKSGNGAAANDRSTHYQSFQIEGLVVVRANVRLF